MIDAVRFTGFLTVSHSLSDGRMQSTLSKARVNGSDAGSYQCAVPGGLDRPFAVDVHVLDGTGITVGQCRRLLRNWPVISQ